MQQEQQQFFITLHPHVFRTKDDFNLGRITNDFKKGIAISRAYTVEEILQLSAQGRCYIPSLIENEDDNYYFTSSKLIFIDVDDVNMVKEPLQVLHELKEFCAGLYYTSSHGIKGNRYRLMFVLDNSIKSQDDYKAVCRQLTARLLKMGVPADTSAQDGLQRIRTSMNGYVLGNISARLSVNEYLELDKLDQQRNKRKQANKVTYLNDYAKRDYTITYQELLEMANHVGYIPSGSGQKDDWVRCVLGLKSYANLGMITQEQGEELFDIISGGEQAANAWNKLNPTSVTIGSFIDFATKTRGFKRNFNFYHAINSTAASRIETVKFDEFIEVEFAKEVLLSEKQTLIDSATGSGKTSSFIQAAKELAADPNGLPSRYYLFAVPMRSIAQQVAKEHDVLEVVGGTDEVFNKIKRYSDSKKRVIVATYDMMPAIVEMIKGINLFASFTLMVDEIHHFTMSYTYRKIAIEGLQKLREVAKGFIGLSGTPQDVLKDGFDREVKIKTSNESVPCRTFGAVTWNRIEGENAKISEKKALIQLVRARVQQGKRLLVFVQNIDAIKSLQKLLIDNNIITHTVTSENKNTNSSYRKIVDNSRFPDNVQVILSTSVISDGINIGMDANDLECIVVCSRDSKLFDPTIIRQMSNRYRTTKDVKFYDYFYLFMQDPQKETEYDFNIESAYSFLHQLATNATNLLNSEFERLDDKRLAPIAALEDKYGIYIDEAANEFKFNALKIRELAYRDKTNFYSVYRNKFIEACSQILEIPAAPTVSIEKLLRENEEEVNNIAQTLEMLRQAALQDDEYKSSQIKRTFTRDVYKAFHNTDDDDSKMVIAEFKRASTVIHFGSLKNMANIVDYETCLTLIEHVTHRTNMNDFTNFVDALCNIRYFEAIRRATPTKKIFNELSKYVGKALTADETKTMLAAISKKLKVSKVADVKKIYQNYFEHVHSRVENARYTTMNVLTIEAVATKFGVTNETVINAMYKNSEKNTDIQQVILKIKV